MDLLDGSNDAGDGAKAGPRERRHLSWIQSSAQEAPMTMSQGAAPVTVDFARWRQRSWIQVKGDLDLGGDGAIDVGSKVWRLSG
jgi:hypothetical protein